MATRAKKRIKKAKNSTQVNVTPWAVALFETICKVQPSSSDSHVPVPVGGKKKVTPTPETGEPSGLTVEQTAPPAIDNDEIEIAKSAFEEDGMSDVERAEDELEVASLLEDDEGFDEDNPLPDRSGEMPEEGVSATASDASSGSDPNAPGAPSKPVRSAPDAINQSVGPTDGDIASGALQIIGPLLDAKDDLFSDNVVAKSYGETCRVPIFKINKKEQIVIGAVLIPGEQDLQDDIMYAPDIQKTAHQYLINSRVVKSIHDGPALAAQVVESYIAPMDMRFDDGGYGAQMIPKGSWILGVKINDPKEWAKVERGEYNGFSVGGQGLRDKLV